MLAGEFFGDEKSYREFRIISRVSTRQADMETRYRQLVRMLCRFKIKAAFLQL